MKIKVSIVEDNLSLAKSIEEKLLLFKDDLKFKFSAVNGIDLMGQLADDHNVDCILMDIEMPEMDGIRATELVKQIYPQIKIIMLTVFDDEEKIFRSIQAGANGYLLKDETPDKIYEGIKTIVDGGAPMSPAIANKALQLLRNPFDSDMENINEDFSLTQREIEILEQLCKGLVYKQIADNLIISPSTVRKHTENIYRKLHVNNKLNAVQKAKKHKII